MAGVSRSASVVLAYLMWREGITAARALRDVQTHRSIANPNSGFRAQLRRWETALQRARAARGLPPLRRADESLVERFPELGEIEKLF
jgi:protein-tyrosine phosphatase